MKVSGSLGLGTLTSVEADRSQAPIAARPSSTIADPITFSSAARSRAEAAAHPRWGPLSAKLHAEPDIADQLVYDYAHTAPQAVLHATEFLNGTGPLRFAGTGEAYTPESKARFALLAEDVKTASIDLYDQERAKGTAPADIFDKLIALYDAQSEEFRGLAHWDSAPE